MLTEKQIKAMAWRMAYLAIDEWLSRPVDEFEEDFEEFELSPQDIHNILHEMKSVTSEIYGIYLEKSHKVIE